MTWAAGARTALDVATGGGHVARRLREAGLEVVTTDAAPGMRPDVVCPAEHLPFADASFDVVACRTAAHHFADVRAAVREMARVARERVLIVDTVNMGDEIEEAERLRDPSHVRNYTDAEWREIVLDAGLGSDEVAFFAHSFDAGAWLARTGCEGDEADARARAARLAGCRRPPHPRQDRDQRGQGGIGTWRSSSTTRHASSCRGSRGRKGASTGCATAPTGRSSSRA